MLGPSEKLRSALETSKSDRHIAVMSWGRRDNQEADKSIPTFPCWKGQRIAQLLDVGRDTDRASDFLACAVGHRPLPRWRAFRDAQHLAATTSELYLRDAAGYMVTFTTVEGSITFTIPHPKRWLGISGFSARQVQS